MFQHMMVRGWKLYVYVMAVCTGVLYVPIYDDARLEAVLYVNADIDTGVPRFLLLPLKSLLCPLLVYKFFFDVFEVSSFHRV